MASSWLELGKIRIRDEDCEESLAPLQKALTQYEALGLRRGVAFASVRLSAAHCLLANYESAFEYAQRGLGLYEQELHHGGIITALEALAKVYEEQHNYQQALLYSEKAMALAEARREDSDRNYPL
jgi:tetratricopeptide (TPR) repeat protein